MRRLALLMTTGLVLALLPLTAAAGGGCHSEAETTTVDYRGTKAGMAASVPISKCAFRPTVVWVDPGATVTWTNNDPLPHTVTGANFVFGDFKELMDGDNIGWTFDEEGVYPYACILHPGMNGAVVVGDGMGDSKSAGISGITQAFTEEPEPPAPVTETIVVEETSGVSRPAFLVSTAAVAIAAFAVGFTLRRRRLALNQATKPASG
jgi:plastocyanin